MKNLPTNSSESDVIASPPGNKINKFLLFGLTFIVLIVVAEGIYFLIQSSTKKTSTTTNEDSNKQREIVSTPNPSSLFKKLDLAKVSNRYDYFKLLGDNGTQDFLSEAKLASTITGTVWITKPEETTVDNIDYVYAILFFDSDQREVRVNFTAEEISSMKFEGLSNLGDIKQGDVISVMRVTNFLNDSADEVTILRISSPSE